MTRQSVILGVCSFAFIGIFSVAALAQEAPAKSIDIDVSSADDGTAVGVIFSAQGAVQRAPSKVKRLDPSTVIVSVPYKESELPRDAMVTALMFSSAGKMSFGNVRPVFVPDARESALTLPLCVPEKANESALQGQIGVLENLVQIRAQRRGVSQVQIARLMSDKFLDRLRRLERGFGLVTTPELGPDLPPVQLIDRLTRILEAVQALKGVSASRGASSSSSKESRSGK